MVMRELDDRSLLGAGTDVMAYATQKPNGTRAAARLSIWKAMAGAADLIARDFSGRDTG